MNRDKGQVKTYLINDVSRRVGLSQKRIREYEKARLIKPARAPRTNNRLYSESDIVNILKVKDLIHQHGFTLSCLQYFLSSAPCWIIFKCTKKSFCPAYKSPHTPCYKAVRDAGQRVKKACLSCPVYMNRNVGCIKLLEKTRTGP